MNNIYIPEYKLKQCPIYGSIVFDKQFDMSSLDHYIVKVIKTISPVPYSWRGIIPATNRISHWLLTVVLDNDKVIVVNTAAKVYITVYNGRINEKYKLINYNDYFGVIKHIYNINDKITLSSFLDKYIKLFKENYKCYTLFGRHNCQYIVADGLNKIFNINDDETTCEKYNIGIIGEIYKNQQYTTNFKNINYKK